MKRTHRHATAVLLVLAGVVADRLALADDNMPTTLPMPPAEVTKRFQYLQWSAPNDSQLSFEMVFPRDWESRTVNVPAELLAHDDSSVVKIAELGPKSGPDKQTAAIDVAYMRVPDYVTLKDYVDKVAPALGFTIVARQEMEPAPGRKLYEAFVRNDHPAAGPGRLMRFSAIRRGEIVFTIVGSAPAKSYAAYKDIFTIAAESFTSTGGARTPAASASPAAPAAPAAPATACAAAQKKINDLSDRQRPHRVIVRDTEAKHGVFRIQQELGAEKARVTAPLQKKISAAAASGDRKAYVELSQAMVQQAGEVDARFKPRIAEAQKAADAEDAASRKLIDQLDVELKAAYKALPAGCESPSGSGA